MHIGNILRLLTDNQVYQAVPALFNESSMESCFFFFFFLNVYPGGQNSSAHTHCISKIILTYVVYLLPLALNPGFFDKFWVYEDTLCYRATLHMRRRTTSRAVDGNKMQPPSHPEDGVASSRLKLGLLGCLYFAQGCVFYRRCGRACCPSAVCPKPPPCDLPRLSAHT